MSGDGENLIIIGEKAAKRRLGAAKRRYWSYNLFIMLLTRFIATTHNNIRHAARIARRAKRGTAAYRPRGAELRDTKKNCTRA